GEGGWGEPKGTMLKHGPAHANLGASDQLPPPHRHLPLGGPSEAGTRVGPEGAAVRGGEVGGHAQGTERFDEGAVHEPMEGTKAAEGPKGHDDRVRQLPVVKDLPPPRRP